VTLDDGDSGVASAALRAAVYDKPGGGGPLRGFERDTLPEQPGPARQHDPETIASAGNST